MNGGSDSSTVIPAPSTAAAEFITKRSRQDDVLSALFEMTDIPMEIPVEPPASAGSATEQVAAYRGTGDMRMQSLLFWIQNESKYPDLSCYAISILSIPATEVSCERAFSSAGAFFSDERARMSNQTLRNLLFVHANDSQLRLWRDEIAGKVSDDDYDDDDDQRE